MKRRGLEALVAENMFMKIQFTVRHNTEIFYTDGKIKMSPIWYQYLNVLHPVVFYIVSRGTDTQRL
jgi:hypothetical protein